MKFKDAVILVADFSDIETEVPFEEETNDSGVVVRNFANGATAVRAEDFTAALRSRMKEIIDEEF